jgi:hypothetical protein
MTDRNTSWAYYRRIPVVVKARKIVVPQMGASPGDYLVRDDTERVYIVPRDDFEDHFEPVVGPEKT